MAPFETLIPSSGWDSGIRNPKPGKQRATRRAAINHRAACERSPPGWVGDTPRMSQNGSS